MWIKELHIKNFGKFNNKKIEFSPGINLIYGENESGKSTLHAFIRGSLYGIRKMRGRASKKDEFSHYQPWDNGNYYAGNLRFVCGDKVFRLERDFASASGDGLLVCETDGELLSLENGDLDMLLGGVGEVAFSNTVSIGQLKNETEEGIVSELQNYIANHQESGDQTIDIDRALQLLKMQTRELERQNLKEKEKQESRIRHLTDYMSYLEEEKNVYAEKLDRVEAELMVTDKWLAQKKRQQADFLDTKMVGADKDAKRSMRKEKIENPDDEDEVLGTYDILRDLWKKRKEKKQLESTRKKSLSERLGIPLALLGIEACVLAVMFLFCFLMNDYDIMKELILVMILITIVVIGGYRMIFYWLNNEAAEDAFDTEEEMEDVFSDDDEYCEEESYDEEDVLEEDFYDGEDVLEEAPGKNKIEDTLFDLKETEEALHRLCWQKEHIQTELEEKQIQLENCRQEIQLCSEAFTGEKTRLYKENKAAIALAREQMINAMRQMQNSKGISLKKRTSEIFSEITDGYYTQVQIDNNLCVGVHTKERYVPLEQLSRGTIWQVYFAYRMAAGEFLTEDEPLPLLLDDAFVMYDEARLMQVLLWLSKQEKQVLLFTCQRREQEVFKKLGISYQEVLL